MDKWDETKLEEVVNKKHGEAEKKNSAKTQIVSEAGGRGHVLLKGNSSLCYRGSVVRFQALLAPTASVISY